MEPGAPEERAARGAVSAVVLCGGFGTRIAGLFPDLPKPLIPAAGQPFLHWVTRWLAGQGASHLVFAAGYRAGQIQDWLEAQAPETGLVLECSVEPEPLGTAGGIRHALETCGETVLVVNGDSLVLADLDAAFARYDAENLDGVLLGLPVEDSSPYGALHLDDQGLLAEIREKAPGRNLINAGVYLFRRSFLETIPLGVALSLEREVLPNALLAGARIGVVPLADTPDETPFLDIGRPETVSLATAFIEAHPSAFPPLGRGAA